MPGSEQPSSPSLVNVFRSLGLTKGSTTPSQSPPVPSSATTATTTAAADINDSRDTPASTSAYEPRKQRSIPLHRLPWVRKGEKAPLPFPPVSWYEGCQTNGTEPQWSPETMPSSQDVSPRASASAHETTSASEGTTERVEPASMAQRVQTMVSALPSFFSSPSRPQPPSLPHAGTESPRSPASPVNDSSSSLGFLLSPRGQSRPLDTDRLSILSAFDPIWSPRGSRSDSLDSFPAESPNGVLDCVDDNNSVMVYGPLEPDETSEVEIACSEIVSLYEDGEEIRTPQSHFVPLPAESIDQVIMGAVEGADTNSSEEQGHHDQANLPPFVPPEETWKSPLSSGGQLPEREYRVWVPSLTKISVQTVWWGFRIYLPPPVLDVLNNKQLEAAKRAAIITAALKWLLDHIPLPLLPPQMRPAIAVLRRLVPYLGYVGGFIAWTWSAIKSFDKGYGVVLKATWLLPLALIPGTWEMDDFPSIHTSPQRTQTASGVPQA